MRLFGLLVKETPPVSLHEGWRGFLFIRITLLYFFVMMGVIDTASVTTGRLILKGWRWHFF